MTVSSAFAQLKNKVQSFVSENGKPDENELVTIATFLPVMQPLAHMLHVKLESEGIICIMNGQVLTRSDFIRLQVRQADAVKATAIVNAFEVVNE